MDTVPKAVTAAVIVRAEDAVADRRLFQLDDAAWASFVAILDRPAQPIPELTGLLREPVPWEDSP